MSIPLTLNNIVQLAVYLSPPAATRSGFNQGLIIGPSAHISAATRVKKYTSPASMLTDGFLDTDPEYLAAQLYFNQVPTPVYLNVGRQVTGTDSILQALEACRAANADWYTAYACAAAKADHVAVAASVESMTPYSMYLFDTQDADAKAGTDGNVFDTLKAAGYNRSMGLWTTTTRAGAALMGRAMGVNTGLANSAFVMDFKNLVGVTAENLAAANPMTENDVSTIHGDNGNVYIQRGSFYNWFEDGRLPSGRWFDQMLNADMLANAIQLNVSDLLNAVPKVPLTDSGVHQIIHVVGQACEAARVRGYLAPGTWMGLQPVLNLNPGDPMPQGYVIQAPTVSSMSNADRSARKSPPIYVACHEANGVQGVLIGVYVD
jgi:hypothetical protein